MKLIKKRNYIHNHLHEIGENVLDEIYELIEKGLQEQDKAVAYKANGDLITKSQYIREIKEAEDQIDKGEYITLENLEEESESW